MISITEEKSGMDQPQNCHFSPLEIVYHTIDIYHTTNAQKLELSDSPNSLPIDSQQTLIRFEYTVKSLGDPNVRNP